MQAPFINEETRHLPPKIVDFAISHKDYFEDIVATEFDNNIDSGCYKLGDWKDCMYYSSNTAVIEPIKKIVTNGIAVTKGYSVLTPEIINYLNANSYDKVYLCGIGTDNNILSSAYGLFDMGQDCAVIEDLCASTQGEEYHNCAIQLIKRNLFGRVINSKCIPSSLKMLKPQEKTQQIKIDER